MTCDIIMYGKLRMPSSTVYTFPDLTKLKQAGLMYVTKKMVDFLHGVSFFCEHTHVVRI
jgi:hypothetical protein